MAEAVVEQNIGASPVLTATDISIRKGGKQVLDAVTLAIFPKERLSIVGPSGAGKTTLLRVLAGLDLPSNGTVTPTPWARGESANRTVRVGLLFQDLGLFPHMRVRENIAFPLLARHVPRKERKRQAQEALERAGLSGYGHRFPLTLSGGERQRVALLRTIMSEPEVILLDEPFASIDSHLIDHFASWLEEIQESAGTPLVLVTHDVQFAMRWSDRVVILQQGRVVQTGLPADVYAEPCTEFVASFLGRTNILPGIVESLHDDSARVRVTCRSLECNVVATIGPGARVGGRCQLIVRPQHLQTTCSQEEAFSAEVSRTEFLGHGVDLLVVTIEGFHLWVRAGRFDRNRRHGDSVLVNWPPVSAHAIAS